MTTDLGNLNRSLRLQCKHCGHRPDENSVMEAMALHFEVEHDTDKYELDLVPVCSCGAAMTVTNTRPDTPGQVKDYLECGVCGNTGHLRRTVPEVTP
jgi:hypothetical protein